MDERTGHGELELLVTATGGSVVQLEWQDDHVHCSSRLDPPPQPLAIPPLDWRSPLPGTEAALHVLLAWLPRDAAARRIAAFRRAPAGLHNRSSLALRLARVRAEGLDVHLGGLRGEVTSVAAPVRGAGDEVTGALALLTPTVYLDDLDVQTVAADLKRLAAG